MDRRARQERVKDWAREMAEHHARRHRQHHARHLQHHKQLHARLHTLLDQHAQEKFTGDIVHDAMLMGLAEATLEQAH